MSRFTVTVIERIQHVVSIEADDAQHAAELIELQFWELMKEVRRETLDIHVGDIVIAAKDGGISNPVSNISKKGRQHE
jgi:hypothetical protein